MDQLQNINLDELEKYVKDRREAEERAQYAAIRAEQQKLLDKIEADREETRRREAEERAKGDVNLRAAAMVHKALGDQWSDFIALMSRGSTAKLVGALNRIEGERAAGLKHRDLNAAPAIRQDREQAIVAARHSGLEAQLAASGIRLGFTPD